MTITLLPIAKTIFVDSNGVPLAGGSVYTYVPNSSTPKLSWQDPGATIPNSNPIILDGSGGCYLWGSGQYREVVYDQYNNLIFDAITEDPGFAVAATFGGTSTTSVAVGTGSKTFTTQPGLQFFPGTTVNIASNASALNYMNGTVASYNTSTGVLVVTVLTDGGSGTYADWNIAVSGIQGPAGTVTAISVASANGFAGSSSGGGTPALTLSTSITGVLKGNGTAISAATAGTDYVIPSGSITGNAATVSTNANLTGPVTSVGNATTISNNVVTEAMLDISNNTTANVTTSAHGFAPILPNNVSLFLNGLGGYTAPVVSALVGTSTTSLAIALGSTTFTTQAGLTLGAGQYVIIPSAANSANYFFGQITSYSGTTLVVNVTVDGGSGTHADWNIFISGPQGPTGGLTTTGSPATGNLTKFSGTSTLTNADLTGDVTTSGTVAATLATVNSNVGSFTNASLTVNAKGLITAASNGVPGNYVLLSSQTISSSTASVSVTAGINSTYSHYIWEIRNLTSVSGSVDGYITVQQGGVFIGGSNYNSIGFKAAAGALNAAQDNSIAEFIATAGYAEINSSFPSLIRFEFWNPSVALPLIAIIESIQDNGSNAYYVRSGGWVGTNVATTGIKLVLSSGNIATCTANLYGIT